MPAVKVDDISAVPRIASMDPGKVAVRPLITVTDAPRMLEGAGFEVRRAFAGIDLRLADPFLLLDHYMMDGELEHRDSNGGGGLITDGATQWMTAGAGIVHSEMPTEEILAKGGLFHGVQLWVNLPKAQKWAKPQYQDLDADQAVLLASEDGGSLVRLIAGDIAGHRGPGSTHTPITYAHVSVSPGARLQVPWPPEFNALVYVLAGRGAVGPDRRPIREGQLAVMGQGDAVTILADPEQDGRSPALEILLLGGSPIREPVSWYGPFVMNTHDEIIHAVADYRSGKMGRIPAKRQQD